MAQVANWFTNARKRLWQPIVKGEVPVTDLYAALFVRLVLLQSLPQLLVGPGCHFVPNMERVDVA